MKPSGHIFFEDEYGSQYRLDWETVGGVIDLTASTFQPFVWGDEPQGYIRGGVLYRRGIMTVDRQVLRVFDGGYEIVADGAAQYVSFEATNFPCQTGPVDNFKYHLNNQLVDECAGIVSDGSRWADPDNVVDADMKWGDINASGVPVVAFTVAGDAFSFIDTWAN